MKSIEILSKPTDGQKNIADTWTTSRRSTSLTPHLGIRGTGTRAPSLLVCNDKDLQAGPMKARREFKPTTKILASLRREQGRQNSLIPKNERRRQRPFDEALRAELVWMSQNWRTYFSQTFSSSSSSQNWCQNERRQDIQWREHQDTQWQKE